MRTGKDMDILRTALANALTAVKGLQDAIDKADVDDAADWLDAMSIDATAALNSISEED